MWQNCTNLNTGNTSPYLGNSGRQRSPGSVQFRRCYSTSLIAPTQLPALSAAAWSSDFSVCLMLLVEVEAKSSLCERTCHSLSKITYNDMIQNVCYIFVDILKSQHVAVTRFPQTTVLPLLWVCVTLTGHLLFVCVTVTFYLSHLNFFSLCHLTFFSLCHLNFFFVSPSLFICVTIMRVCVTRLMGDHKINSFQSCNLIYIYTGFLIPFPDVVIVLTASPMPCRQLNARWQQPKCKWRPRKKLSRPFSNGDITWDVIDPVFQKCAFGKTCKKLGNPRQLA